MLQNLYDFAKFQYNCGNYSGAAEMLYHFRILVSKIYKNKITLCFNLLIGKNIFQSTDENLNLQALWGKLASEILTTNWETALEDLNKLKEAIDQKVSKIIIKVVVMLLNLEFFGIEIKCILFQ